MIRRNKINDDEHKESVFSIKTKHFNGTDLQPNSDSRNQARSCTKPIEKQNSFFESCNFIKSIVSPDEKREKCNEIGRCWPYSEFP